MPDYVVRRAQALLNNDSRALRGARILMLGLAYKAGTSDWRESPSMTIAERLIGLGADVRAHDAHVPQDSGPTMPRVDCSVEEIEAADLVLLLVNHPDLPLDLIAAKGASRTRHAVRAARAQLPRRDALTLRSTPLFPPSM